ncbi:MAG TPA: fumarate hydratase [Anaerohalosphaeraceae bacterium]|nr:fumarate hydratase [Phycisphaerae bacterium]HOK96564.1 fumarate hydratase [Anaerohalosphaeraceae bacterium]HOL30817.1 fumarate hydratase [Anaerohalosphaeraceae bacterium]HOM75785.1 fumarate hydratase [Anaerohalosphaeraceae bacterium]HPC64537.1 fumarate hydratase [Anaerohalosphaeraceae bacterium]
MRTIAYNQVVQSVETLCIDCAFQLPPDVAQALRQAAGRETNPRAREILEQLIENARIAAEERIPLCQDTGLAVVFVQQGADVQIVPPDDKPAATIVDAICQGVAAGYEKGFLRKSVVAEPLNRRQNTQTNTPPVIHYSVVPGQTVHISLMAKGGGCENKSCLRMFNPTDSKEAVIDWIVQAVKQAGASACPPFVVGVGLGGNFELSCLLAKKSLLRKIGEANPDPFYAQMEQDLLAAVNASGLGPMGLGGDTTALAVCIETAPCHIASLPAAVNIECHSHRHKSITI